MMKYKPELSPCGLKLYPVTGKILTSDRERYLILQLIRTCERPVNNNNNSSFQLVEIMKEATCISVFNINNIITCL